MQKVAGEQSSGNIVHKRRVSRKSVNPSDTVTDLVFIEVSFWFRALPCPSAPTP